MHPGRGLTEPTSAEYRQARPWSWLAGVQQRVAFPSPAALMERLVGARLPEAAVGCGVAC
ncbi:MAG: hypothetical protein R2844_07685 [Caldilineales bacterium]